MKRYLTSFRYFVARPPSTTRQCVRWFASGLLAMGGFSLLLAAPAHAEVWSDATGKFQVEADYAGVQGSRVVLRKPDGTTIEVPIARLSPASRALAKRAYEQSRPNPTAEISGNSDMAASGATARTMAEPLVATPPNRSINFTPPVPPATQPMAAFPADARLQETVDFVFDQTLAGHPEVFWEALPAEMRQKFDEPELRSQLATMVTEQSPVSDAIVDTILKAMDVLVNKKEFVLNSPIMAQVSPPMLPMVKQGYDPAVGVLYELLMFPTDSSSLSSRPFGELISERGPRIGAHLQALVKLAPPEQIEQLRSQIQITQSDDTTGTMVIPDNKGGTETTTMVKVQSRWIPQDLAKKWASSRNTLQADLTASMQKMKAERQATQAQVGVVVQMVTMMAGTVLEPLSAAQTQAEFDQVLIQAMSQMGGLIGPAGAGRVAPGPGFDGP